MPVIEQEFIHRSDLRAHPDWLFIFGDNFARCGLGGQAAEMRGEPNAVGIPTKARPSNNADAFLCDGDIYRWRTEVFPIFEMLLQKIEAGNTIVIPSHGIGGGLAALEIKSPLIWKELNEWISRLKAENANL